MTSETKTCCGLGDHDDRFNEWRYGSLLADVVAALVAEAGPVHSARLATDTLSTAGALPAVARLARGATLAAGSELTGTLLGALVVLANTTAASLVLVAVRTGAFDRVALGTVAEETVFALDRLRAAFALGDGLERLALVVVAVARSARVVATAGSVDGLVVGALAVVAVEASGAELVVGAEVTGMAAAGRGQTLVLRSRAVTRLAVGWRTAASTDGLCWLRTVGAGGRNGRLSIRSTALEVGVDGGCDVLKQVSVEKSRRSRLSRLQRDERRNGEESAGFERGAHGEDRGDGPGEVEASGVRAGQVEAETRELEQMSEGVLIWSQLDSTGR